jgi:CRISPR-associated protein Cas2
MTVIILTACPAGLRGHLTKWLLEISAGVFVGNVTSRVRNLLWARVVELSSDGRALMVHSVPGEQRLSCKVHGHHWKPVDYEGITLILRPDPNSAHPQRPHLRQTGARSATASASPVAQPTSQALQPTRQKSARRCTRIAGQQACSPRPRG